MKRENNSLNCPLNLLCVVLQKFLIVMLPKRNACINLKSILPLFMTKDFCLSKDFPLKAMAIVFLVNKLIKPENDLSRLNLPCRKEEVSLQRGILRRLVKNRADFRKMLITVSVRKSYLSPKALRGLLSWKI